MRKKTWRIFFITVLVVILFFAGILFRRFVKADTGTYIAADSPVIVFDNGSGEPVVLLSSRKGIFANLQTGDRILVFHDGTMMLSYPAQMNVFFCIRLKKGNVSDVPEGVMDSLENMGWLQGGTLGQNQ